MAYQNQRQNHPNTNMGAYHYDFHEKTYTAEASDLGWPVGKHLQELNFEGCPAPLVHTEPTSPNDPTPRYWIYKAPKSQIRIYVFND